jgi:ribosomal-protein-alanine N-acetyltransferase
MDDGQFPYYIRPMRWDDVPAVMDIERESFPLPWSSYTYRHELTENTHSHYIVVQPRVAGPDPRPWWQRMLRPPSPPIVGYGGFWLVADEAHISTIAIALQWRGRGIGELLLAAMIEQAIEMKAGMVTLEVRVSNHVAQNLYRKYDLVITGTRPRYYRDNDEDAHIMTVEAVTSDKYREKLAKLQAALAARLRADVAQDAGQKSAVRL